MSLRRQQSGGGGIAGGQVKTQDRFLRGYAQRRVDYDRRRRARRKSAAEREWMGVLRRDPCAYCPPGPALHPQNAVDHIVPLGLGGEDAASNTTCACRRCNAAKRDTGLLLFLLARRAT